VPAISNAGTRVGSDRVSRGEWQLRPYSPAAFRPGTSRQCAAVYGHPLVHADQPVPVGSGAAVAWRHRGSGAIVGHLQLDRVGAMVEAYHCPGSRASVAERVGQRLLDQPVDGQLDRCGQGRRLAGPLQLD
jgi:hypothetical protein